MPTISRFFGILIKMYFDEHNPPHFHVYYNSYSASIAIETLELQAGKLPKRAYALVLEWASEHRQELMDNWILAQQGLPPVSIKPLE